MAIIDKPRNKTYLIGNWMPSDQTTLANWMRKIIDKAAISHAPLLPSVQNLKDFIESNPKAYMFFNQMFDNADKKDPSAGLPQVRDYQHMLELFNVIMTHAPDFDDTGLVGFPFNAILDWSMATNAGWSAFLDGEVNVHLKAMLNE
ncbi:phophatidylserine decarboxylase associated domain-containing protein [Arsenophonus nasoniae]|uniref:Phophatidylserine decarboxylase associated domain-containing protein n=2 Tax=Arsenophonus nasoniae TaxID=638 RepID=A0AA95K732_9GAMM|nr:phophatidylserine decarboxylase associated domain-containing protein [Arsenophonus nasoniae]WGL94878.1 phophatidylserine decarboxylase associated domain-containing protein [Arsenophonus nasoniae]